MGELKEPGRRSEPNRVVEILIDRDCPMCRQFGQKRSSEGFAVTPREAALGGSIEVMMADGTSRAGYDAMLEIYKARKNLPNWLYSFLKLPICELPGRIGYRLIARNRNSLSRFLAPKEGK